MDRTHLQRVGPPLLMVTYGPPFTIIHHGYIWLLHHQHHSPMISIHLLHIYHSESFRLGLSLFCFDVVLFRQFLRELIGLSGLPRIISHVTPDVVWRYLFCCCCFAVSLLVFPAEHLGIPGPAKMYGFSSLGDLVSVQFWRQKLEAIRWSRFRLPHLYSLEIFGACSSPSVFTWHQNMKPSVQENEYK